MDYEHYMRARMANAGDMGEPKDPASVAKAIIALGGMLQETSDSAMAGIAALNDLIEAGAEDEELFSSANALGTRLAQVIAVAYRLAAALWVPEFDGWVSTALMNSAK